MTVESSKFVLRLLGPFALFDPAGNRVQVGRKAAATLAILATSRDGERSRRWLQDVLWGSRGLEQAQASLRRELANLRPLLNRPGMPPVLSTTPELARLHLELVETDLDGAETWDQGVFLEGLDFRGEEAFEDWLRAQRSRLEERRGERVGATPPAGVASLPPAILANHATGVGFFGRPFLAVRPFANLTGDPERAYLAEGLAEELIERLSRLRWIPIISREASFSERLAGASLQEQGRSLNARYIVTGELHLRDQALSLTAAVSDTETGLAVSSWRKSLPKDVGSRDLDEILLEVVSGLANRVDDAEMVRAVAGPAVNNLIWRARWHHNRYTEADGSIAEELLQQALLQEPNSPEAIIQLADFRQRQLWLRRAQPEEIIELRRLAQRAITADYLDGRGYLFAGIAELWLTHTDAALSLFNRALELNPSLAYAYSQIGAAHYLSGRPGPAIDMLTRAIQLNMGEQHAYYVLGEIAMAHAMLASWDKAIQAANESLNRRPGYWYAHAIKIHALASRGEGAAAEAAFRLLMRSKPRFRPDFLDWVPFVGEAGLGWRNTMKRTLEAMFAGARTKGGDEGA